MRTGLTAHVDPSGLRLGDQANAASGRGVDDVRPAARFLGKEDRPADRLDLGERGPRCDEVSWGDTPGCACPGTQGADELGVLRVQEQDRVEARNRLHALVECEVADGRELVDAGVAHEGLEAGDAALVLLGEPVDVPLDEPAPESEVDERRSLDGRQLLVEGRPVDGDGHVVQRHVHVRRVPARGEGPGAA